MFCIGAFGIVPCFQPCGLPKQHSLRAGLAARPSARRSMRVVNLQSQFGSHIDRREIRQDYRHGFSILKTNRETGARTCEIYLPNDQRPLKVDDVGTMTLGHELLHCMLGDYHR